MDDGWAFGLVVMSAVVVLVVFILTLNTNAMNAFNHAVEAGLQQCQSIGNTGTYWARECVR